MKYSPIAKGIFMAFYMTAITIPVSALSADYDIIQQTGGAIVVTGNDTTNTIAVHDGGLLFDGVDISGNNQTNRIIVDRNGVIWTGVTINGSQQSNFILVDALTTGNPHISKITIHNVLGDNEINVINDAFVPGNGSTYAIEVSGSHNTTLNLDNANTNGISITDNHGDIKINATGGTALGYMPGGSLPGGVNGGNWGPILLENAGGTSTLLMDAGTYVAGDVTFKGSADASLEIAGTTTRSNGSIRRAGVFGNINAADVTGQSSITLEQGATVTGDVTLNNGTLTLNDTVDPRDNSYAVVGGMIRGTQGGYSILSLGDNVPSFDGGKFSGISELNIQGNTNLNGGINNANVGNALTISGPGVLTTGVNLSQGDLTINKGKVLAENLTLTNSATLSLNNSSLYTSTEQLFNNTLDNKGVVTETGGFNATGQRMTIKESSLVFSDDYFNLGYVKSINSLLNSGNNALNNLVMKGELVTGVGGADNIVDNISVIEAATTGTTLTQTSTVTDKYHLLVGSDAFSSQNQDVVAQGFGAASLQLGAAPDDGSANEVTITQGQFLTLTGANGGPLISVKGAEKASIHVNVENGRLQLGSLVVPNAVDTLNGAVTIGEAGEMRVAAGQHTITDAGITSRGTVTVDDSAVLNANVTLEQGSLNVLGNLNSNTLVASPDTVISVGNADSAGSLVINDAHLNGAKVFLDPVWQDGATIGSASQVVQGGGEVNGLFTVGQNSLLVLGDTTANNALDMFASSGLKWGADDVTAAVGIVTPQTLESGYGGLRLDGSLTTDSVDKDAVANQARFADHSLLMVSAPAALGQAALSANGGTLEVADGAALYLADAKNNRSYTITDGFTTSTVAQNGWNGENLILNKLLDAQRTESNGVVTITTTAKAAGENLPNAVIPHILDSLMQSGNNATTSPVAGIRLLSRALEAPQMSRAEVTKTLNSAAQLATAGGVQNALLTAGGAAAKAIQDHNSIVNHPANAAGQGADVWVNVLYDNNHNRDFSAGKMAYGYNTNLYGVIVGADITRDVAGGALRSGAAVYAGNGKVNSHGDFNSTKNDVDFYGISLYQNWRKGEFNLMADIGYAASNNDLQQRMPGSLDMGNRLKGTVDGTMFTVGATAEYRFSSNIVDLTPYAGVRYNQLITDGFTTKSVNQEAIFHTDRENQTIWQFPVGFRLSKTLSTTQGWAVNPQANFAVVPVAGNRDANMKVRAYGVNASDTLNAQIMDSTAFNGQLGVTFAKENITWGVNYQLTASQHETGQSGVVSMSYAF